MQNSCMWRRWCLGSSLVVLSFCCCCCRSSVQAQTQGVFTTVSPGGTTLGGYLGGAFTLLAQDWRVIPGLTLLSSSGGGPLVYSDNAGNSAPSADSGAETETCAVASMGYNLSGLPAIGAGGLPAASVAGIFTDAFHCEAYADGSGNVDRGLARGTVLSRANWTWDLTTNTGDPCDVVVDLEAHVVSGGSGLAGAGRTLTCQITVDNRVVLSINAGGIIIDNSTWEPLPQLNGMDVNEVINPHFTVFNVASGSRWQFRGTGVDENNSPDVWMTDAVAIFPMWQPFQVTDPFMLSDIFSCEMSLTAN